MTRSISAGLRVARLRRDLRSGRARTIRERAGLSQSELARTLGVHAVTVNGWECGRKTPRFDMALRYGALLDELRRVTP